ncbi:hypothetical protein K502DRAFT_364051 [Neoconidiobolus thromboides FSU 785]|nr:hypothetical protein K502DRAFT_364051 [Neoconidiobolus thromboides FSU 785]
MSRFFKGDSDSDSETSSSEESYMSDDMSQDDFSQGKESDSDGSDKSDDEASPNAWFKKDDNDDSDDEEDSKKIVKSAKDKRFDEIEACRKSIENYLKINDWVSSSNEYEKMNKTVAKLKLTSIKPPTSYFNALIILEDGLNEATKEKKKMNAPNSKAMNSLKQKLKKNNRDYEKQIKILREGGELDEPAPEAPAPVTSKRNKKVAFETREESDDGGFTSVGKGGRKNDITSDMVLKKLKEIIQARGKKNTDKGEQVSLLQKLFEAASTPRHKIKVLFVLISSRLDYGSGIGNFTPVDTWRNALKEINLLFNILEESREINISESFEDVDEEDPDNTKDLNNIQGSVISLIERLDEELTKSLQNIDPHTNEYIERLSDEPLLISLILRSQQYFESKEQTSEYTRALARVIEHLYYKPDNLVSAIQKIALKKLPNLALKQIDFASEPSDLISQLCAYMYTHAEPLLRTRAMLYHIYNVAFHGHYYTARDMLLMSHLQESIHQADVPTMILYNRTMVQIGIAAFKQGLIRESLNCLQEIYNSGRVKEMLGQGVTQQRHNNPNTEQERLEKLRMLPFHLHINLELLECIYLTSSFLLEIPNMARAGSNPDARKNIISKAFRRLLDQSNRQIFCGPPENTREHIISAAKSLSSGDWEEAKEYVWSIKIWELLPEKDKVLQVLANKIQEEGLRTYLFSYSAYYSTLSLEQLSEMFGLSKQMVISIVSKMIWNEELVAGLDQSRDIVVLHSEELSKVQLLGVLIGEKLTSIVEVNQKGFDSKMAELDTQYHTQDRRKGTQTQGKKQIDHKYNSNKPRRNFNQTNRAK